ncbi:hypothetical protein A9266_16830 [Vibrio tasmaniensis]|nr:hypothetical protein A9266_16830 [Vibrio tasmaniensis]
MNFEANKPLSLSKLMGAKKLPIKIKRPKAALFFYVIASLYKQANATSIVLMVIAFANDNSAH